jgi:glycerol-3-phosphate dehydrogenase
MDRFIETTQESRFDVLVIGGGITGSAVAYEAASRGLKVALAEKSDFGSGTSAATSKMIHGGFRYLTKFEIGLVRESLRERRILMNIAPNLVFPLPFVLAHYTGDPYPKWLVQAGMLFYDLLSPDKNNLWDQSKKMPWHRNVDRQELIHREPEVLQTGLKGGSLYYDCMNFYPERLTLAFLKSAVNQGAAISNYAEVKKILMSKRNGRKTISGALIEDRIKNREISIPCRYVVNCTGPWADQILANITGKQENKLIRRSEGIHIITRQKVNQYVITASTKEGRHCFFVPWRGHTLIGTTDKEYMGDPDDYRITKKAILEFLEDINPVFGQSGKITPKDVLYAYGGLRPLVEDQTKDSYHSSRKYEISTHDNEGISGLMTVEGGKYTTSRNLARKVTNRILRDLKKPWVPSVSAKKYLTGCEIINLDVFIRDKQTEYSSFDKRQLHFLGTLYGTELDSLMKIATEDPSLRTNLTKEGEIGAQIVYALRHEMARTLNDILLRRTAMGTLGYPGKKLLAQVAETAAQEAGWNDSRKKQELENMEKHYTIPDQ